MTIGRQSRTSLPAYDRALRLLAHRDRTEAEIRRTLLRAGVEPSEIDRVLVRLTARGFLDDRRYAERFSRSGLGLRGIGTRRLRAEMARRGVDRKTAQQGLEAALGDVDEAAVLETLAEKFWARHRDEPPVRIKKLWAFLARRGFPPEMIRDRLGALWPRWRSAIADLELPPEEPETDRAQSVKPPPRGRTS